MPIRSNITKQDYKYNVFTKEPIFEVDAFYSIGMRISDIWTDKNSLFIEVFLNNDYKSILKFTLFENNLLNIKYYQKELFKTRYDDQIYQKLKTQKINYQDFADKIVLELANQEQLVITKKPFQMSLVDKKGNVKVQTSLRPGYGYLDGYCTPPIGFKTKAGISKPFLSFNLTNNDLIYGLGEKFNNLVKNGIQSVVYNQDPAVVCNGDVAYAGVPLIYSTQNWGLLMNTSHKTTWEIGAPTTDSLSVMSDEESLDLVLFTGDSLKDLVSQYTLLTGRITGVPDEAYGIWVNRMYYHNKNELFTEIDNALKNDYPFDVFTLDPKWLNNRFTKGTNFEFNETQFGDPKKLFQEVHKKGFKMCFWLNPYLQIDNSQTWTEAYEKQYYIKKIDGSVSHIWAGPDGYQESATAVDFTNPEATEWWKGKIKHYLNLGLDFIKTDYGDGIDENALFFNGETGKNFKQSYIQLYLKAAYEAISEVYGVGKGFSLARPGYIGTQQYVGKWGGDSAQTFNESKLQFLSGLSSSFSGTVMWGTDIGGFFDLKTEETDLYARWSEYGLFTPFSRYHGQGAGREPWYYGDENFKISQKYAFLKRQLLPYYKIYEKQAIETGLPIMRAMVLEYQNDFVARKIDDQFFLGENLMMAPIFTNHTTHRQVYFPAGQWFDFFDQTVYEGNKVYDLECPLDKILMFVKGGAAIPLIKNQNYKYSDLAKETIQLLTFGELKDQKLEFQLHDCNYQVQIKNHQISNSNKKELELVSKK